MGCSSRSLSRPTRSSSAFSHADVALVFLHHARAPLSLRMRSKSLCPLHAAFRHLSSLGRDGRARAGLRAAAVPRRGPRHEVHGRLRRVLGVVVVASSSVGPALSLTALFATRWSTGETSLYRPCKNRDLDVSPSSPIPPTAGCSTSIGEVPKGRWPPDEPRSLEKGGRGGETLMLHIQVHSLSHVSLAYIYACCSRF